MAKEQSTIKILSGVGIIAAYGLITMSSGHMDSNGTTINTVPVYNHETTNFVHSGALDSYSSFLSDSAMGDIVLPEKPFAFVSLHEKMKVNLQDNVQKKNKTGVLPS